eukprot:792417-Ditylum_brightwellii.AAC.1
MNLWSNKVRISLFKYETSGGVCNHVVAIKIPYGIDKDDERLSTGSSTALASALASAVLPNGTTIENCSTQQRQKVLDDLTYLIRCGDVIDDEEDFLLASDMRKLNCHGNREGKKFKKFWDAAERVIELDGS